jgi:hypothetical protein
MILLYAKRIWGGMNLISRAFAEFYRQDIKPWLASRRREIRSAYIGPGWCGINGYEITGRLIWGTFLVFLWLFLCLFSVLAFIAVVYQIIEAVAFLLKWVGLE